MATQIKLRRDTAANWASEDPVLAQGEPGFDTTNNILKIGDGSTIWSLLPSIYDPSTDIIPSADNTYDLGTPSMRWRHGYFATGSLYVGDIKLSNNAGKLEITKVINPGEETEEPDPEDSNAGDSVTSKLTNGEHEFKLESDGTLSLDGSPYSGGSGGGSTGDINFDGTDIYAPNNQVISIYAQDDTDIGRASLTLDPGEGYPVARLKTLYPNNSSFSSDAWTGTAQWIVNGGGGRIDFTSQTLLDFLYNTLVHCDNITIEVNGQNAGAYYGANTGPGYVQFNVQNPPVESPDTVVEIKFNYDEVGQIYLDHNEGTMEINGGTGLSLSLKTRQGMTLSANGKNWNFGTDGNLQLPNGGDIRDSSGNSVLGGGSGVDGLSGNTNFTPEAEGDTRYELDINEDITLRIYQGVSGPNNLGPGISLGANIGDPHRSGVVAIGNDDVGYNSKAGGVYIGAKAGWNSDEGQQGANAIAIGTKAAYDFAEDNSITLNATGENLNPTGAGLFVKPVREDVENTIKSVYYNVATGEMTYADPTGGASDQNIWIQTFLTDTPGTDRPGSVNSVEYDADGNIIALFSVYPPQGGDNYTALAKFTSTGTKLWQVRFDGSGSTDGWGVAVDSQNGFIYATARTTDPMGYDRTTVTQFSLADGSINWSKVYDFGYASTNGVIDADNGDAVFVGFANTATGNQVTVVKIAGEDGSVYWANALDGQGYEEAYGMAIGPSGEVAVIGYMSQLGTIDGAATLYTDPVSNPNWTTGTTIAVGQDIKFTVSFVDGVPSFTNIIDRVGGRTVDGVVATVNGASIGGVTGVDDMIVKVGSIAASSEDDHMLVAKYNSDGTLAWQKAVLFDTGYNCNGADADIDSAGNIYVVGQYQKDNGQGGTDTAMNLVKFDSSGAAQWSRRVVGDCATFATSIVVGPDDYLYLSGIAGTEATGDFACVIAKYQQNGQVAWQRLLDNVTTWSFAGAFFTNTGSGSNIAVKDGYVVIGGGFGDPGTGAFAMMAQFDTAGTMFAVDNWDYKQATFSGLLSSDASDITVTNANKENIDIFGNITITNFSPDIDTSNFLVPTIYRLGDASTGDLTFIGNDIIGSGAAEQDFAYGRMSLVPHDGSNNGQSFRDYGQYIDIYPTLANDGPHIHIAAGKGATSTGDLILGDDNQHIDINHQGYVKIRAFTDKQVPTTITLSNAEHAASNGVYEKTNYYPPRWVKDAIVTSEQYIVFDNNQWRVFDIGVNDNDPLYVSSNTIDNPPAQWNLGTFASAPAPNAAYYPPVGYSRDWQFKTDGTVNFPNLEVDLHNGGLQTGQVLQFGDWTQQAIITGPRPPLGNNAQRLIIQGQRGNGVNSEGGDVYLWAGDAVTNGGDIKIYAGDADSNTAGFGGYINIAGGNGYNEGGHVHIDGGYSNNGGGGDVRLQSGGGNVPGKVQIVANNQTWEFEPTGKTTFPGAVIKGTVAKTGADPADIGKGAAATVTVSPTNNTNLNVGTVNGIAFGTGFTLNVTVAENGDISAVVIYSIPNLSVGDYGTLGGGGVLGGTMGVDDITFTVETLTNVITDTAIDLTKSVNKLTDGQYTLADGVEGQIMYFVPQTGAYSYNGVNTPILITITNVRRWNSSTGLAEVSTPGGWLPFVENAVDNAGAEIIGRFGASTMAYAIFTDGAWNVFGGAMD